MSLSVLNTCWNLSLHTQTSETDNPTKKPQNKIEVGQWVLVLLDSEYNLQTEEKKICCFSEPFLWRFLTPRFCDSCISQSFQAAGSRSFRGGYCSQSWTLLLSSFMCVQCRAKRRCICQCQSSPSTVRNWGETPEETQATISAAWSSGNKHWC